MTDYFEEYAAKAPSHIKSIVEEILMLYRPSPDKNKLYYELNKAGYGKPIVFKFLRYSDYLNRIHRPWVLNPSALAKENQFFPEYFLHRDSKSWTSYEWKTRIGHYANGIPIPITDTLFKRGAIVYGIYNSFWYEIAVRKGDVYTGSSLLLEGADINSCEHLKDVNYLIDWTILRTGRRAMEFIMQYSPRKAGDGDTLLDEAILLLPFHPEDRETD